MFKVFLCVQYYTVYRYYVIFEDVSLDFSFLLSTPAKECWDIVGCGLAFSVRIVLNLLVGKNSSGNLRICTTKKLRKYIKKSLKIPLFKIL
jgi:hypothetical protein